MPELPDLHVFAENLKSKTVGKSVTSVEVYKDKRVKPSVDALLQAVRGKSVTDVRRSGKELVFDFNGSEVYVHLMLNGFFTFHDLLSYPKYKMLTFEFDGFYLTLSDRQAYASVEVDKNDSDIPDAMGESFSFEYLNKMIKKSPRKNLKALLLDQKIVRGIGNAYADEILWDCKISPKSKCGKIPESKIFELYDSIQSVLGNAIIQISEHAPGVTGGEYRDFLRVHNKNINMTATGSKIIVEKIASKKTYYTDEQEEFV